MLIITFFYTDKETGAVLSAPASAQNVSPSIIFESKELFWDVINIEWHSSYNELKYWQAPWTIMTLFGFLKSFFLSLIKFSLSFWDILMDSLLSYTFIVGTTYEYHFQNDTDATISQLNCTGGEEVIDTGNETMYYRYDCFKKDEELGYLTLSPVFIPGIMLSFILARSLWKSPNRLYLYLCIAATPILCIIFPLLLVLTKVSDNPIDQEYSLYKKFSFQKNFTFILT